MLALLMSWENMAVVVVLIISTAVEKVRGGGFCCIQAV